MFGRTPPTPKPPPNEVLPSGEIVEADTRDHRPPPPNLDMARTAWQRQEAELKAQFVELLRSRVEERGITGVSIDWGDTIRVARDRDTGLLTALVNCLVWFEQADLLEDSEAASIPRDATAVFHYEGQKRSQIGVWGSGGRVLFNMAPAQALERLAHQFEPVEDDWSTGR